MSVEVIIDLSGSHSPELNLEDDDRETAEYRASVLNSMRRLMRKRAESAQQYHLIIQDRSMANPYHLNENSNRLQSSLLPSLRHQLISLVCSLDPSALRQDPNQRFKLIPHKLLELEQSFDQIASSFLLRSPRADQQGSSDDCYMTLVIHLRLATKIARIKDQIHNLLHTSCELIASANFSKHLITDSSSKANVSDRFSQFHIDKAKSIRLIDELNEWFGTPVFRNIHEFWKDIATSIREPLSDLTDFIRWAPCPQELELVDEELQTAKLIKLAILALPIMKLVRLFFHKLSQAAAVRESFMTDLEMCVARVDEILRISISITCNLESLIRVFDSIDEDEALTLMEEIQAISKHFNSLFPLLNSYILAPSTPHVEPLSSDQASKIKQFNSWSCVWNDQFTLATGNFINACLLQLDEHAIPTNVRNELEPVGELREEH